MIIAVASAFDGLEIITLRWGDITQAGASAHNVDDDAGQFRGGEVAYAFLHQADAGAG